MPADGMLRVVRPVPTGRIERRGRIHVHLDGRDRGRLASGESIDLDVSAGRHRLVAGGAGGYGSPPLPVEVPSEAVVTVRIEPADGAWWERGHYYDSMYRLVVDGPGGAQTPPPRNPATNTVDLSPRGIRWRALYLTATLFVFVAPHFLHGLGLAGLVIAYVLQGLLLTGAAVVVVWWFRRTSGPGRESPASTTSAAAGQRCGPPDRPVDRLWRR